MRVPKRAWQIIILVCCVINQRQTWFPSLLDVLLTRSLQLSWGLPCQELSLKEQSGFINSSLNKSITARCCWINAGAGAQRELPHLGLPSITWGIPLLGSFCWDGCRWAHKLIPTFLGFQQLLLACSVFAAGVQGLGLVRDSWCGASLDIPGAEPTLKEPQCSATAAKSALSLPSIKFPRILSHAYPQFFWLVTPAFLSD